MKKLDVARLGQVFTPEAVVMTMLGLKRNNGRTLEPAAGDGAFVKHLENCVSIEFDPSVATGKSLVMDFFAYPEVEKFDSIISNPPYVRFQDILPETKELLDLEAFDLRSNLFLFFIDKSLRHLREGGELIIICPRELAKLTSARKLNERLWSLGTITDWIELGDARVFDGSVPNVVIFRFELGNFSRRLSDGRKFCINDGQLLFLSSECSVPLKRVFDVRVGAVSGADDVFSHPEGNLDFVCSTTASDGLTRKMLYDRARPHPLLLQHKIRLLGRRVRKFSEDNWWTWGRDHHRSSLPRIYVNGRTRNKKPFFLHSCSNYDGSILALFPRASNVDMDLLVSMLNDVPWEELGFVCDGRYLFSQRSLSACLLPKEFEPFEFVAKAS